MRAALFYTIKVWLTSITIGSIALWSTIIIFSTAKGVIWNEIPMYLSLTFAIATLISCPSSILLFLFSFLLMRKQVTPLKIKTILSLIAMVSCFITFSIVAKSDHNSVFDKGNFTLLLCYALPIPMCIWFYSYTSLKSPNVPQVTIENN